ARVSPAFPYTTLFRSGNRDTYHVRNPERQVGAGLPPVRAAVSAGKQERGARGRGPARFALLDLGDLRRAEAVRARSDQSDGVRRSEEHTSELQSLTNL